MYSDKIAEIVDDELVQVTGVGKKRSRQKIRRAGKRLEEQAKD